MNFSAASLLAQTISTTQRTTFEWGRLHSFTNAGHWLLLVGVCVAVLWFVWYMYRRDSAELSPWIGGLLMLLRVCVFVALLLVYLKPQWRTDEDKVINSRVIVLADTSLSMGLTDRLPGQTQTGPSRSEQVVEGLDASGLLNRLRQTHDVQVIRFDAETGQVARLGKLKASPDRADGATDANPSTTADAAPDGTTEPEVDWTEALSPRGSETRLGQALRQIINDERGEPLAGIIVFTDGGNNAGIEPVAAIEAAREARIPIFTVGVGTDRQPTNVRVVDLLLPARAYPGDAYTATGYIQGQGLEGETVTVELLSKAAADGAEDDDPGQVDALDQVVLGADGEVVPIKFELQPDETGRRSMSLRVRPPPTDGNPNDDLFGPVDIEIVEHKTRVLLFAGGPTREYIFLRNLLRRDRDVVVDVLLQTAQPGIAQDANEILDEFPPSREELYEYDCIVAFDPDWQELTVEELELLEAWVAEQAGGLIAVAGPIHTSSWVRSAEMSVVRNLYPVEFHRRFSLLDDSRTGSKDPWPLDFGSEGMAAEFLWLDDSATRSGQIWASFRGVYGYHSVRGPKPAATVYARFSDPLAASEGDPVYMAGQFYGSGRVFYLGSGEMWRLRSMDEAHFEQLYTKLVRHVSQGRLLRGSNRGVLLVERDRYQMGNMVVVRAQLNNAQLEPLEAPEVPLEVIHPDGQLQNVMLSPVISTPGSFGGQFNVYKQGAYRLELPVPESSDERLTRRIQVRVPELERENPRRNDPLLSEIAGSTGGVYYVGVQRALVGAGEQGAEGGEQRASSGVGGDQRPLVEQLPDRRRTMTITATPKAIWDNKWVMWAICGLLCLEWLIRRIVKLA